MKNQKSFSKSWRQNANPKWHQKFQHFSSIRKCLKIERTDSEEKEEEERRQTRSIFCPFKSAIKTSIMDILAHNFLPYVRMCLLKQRKYSKEVRMGGNNVRIDDENSLLSYGIYSSDAAACLFRKSVRKKNGKVWRYNY